MKSFEGIFWVLVLFLFLDNRHGSVLLCYLYFYILGDFYYQTLVGKRIFTRLIAINWGSDIILSVQVI